MSGTTPPPPAALPPPTGGHRVRRLTRWPVVIGAIVVILPFVVAGYVLTHTNGGDGSPSDEDSALSTRGANAGAALAHASDGNIERVALAKPATTTKPAPAAKPAAAAPPPPTETDAEHKARAAAWDAYYKAVASEEDRRITATVAALTADSIQATRAPAQTGSGAPPAGGTGGGPGSMDPDVTAARARLGGGYGGGRGGSGYFGPQGPSDPSTDYSPFTLTEPVSAYEIKAGDVITGTLMTGINSDSPGTIVGVVGKPVTAYATRDSTHPDVLIPQGTRIVGSYNSAGVAYGQDRLEVGLERLIYPAPCAQSLDLGRMIGSDVSGRAGFEDQTNNHWGKVFIKALLLGGVSAGVQLSQPQQSAFAAPSAAQIAAGALGQQMGQLALENARRGLDIPPTQEIRPGYPFTLIVQHDIALAEPYSCPEAGIIDGQPATGAPIPLAVGYGR